MPVKKEREYRTVAAPLSVAAAAKRIDTEYYVEGYATTFAGVVNINENDALIIRAVTLFVKAEFNYQNAADRYRQSYEALKMSLCLAGDYNTKEG